jgi:mannose-6-phosphate isomerase-like protein (cupin superfamily)
MVKVPVAASMSYEQGLEEREYVAKMWGMEEILVNNDKYCSKLLWITPGFQCSLHYHEIKQETFIAIDGLTRVEYIVGNKKYDTILVGWRRDVLTLPPKTPHRFWSLGGDGSLLLEVSTPHSDTDVTRIEPSRPLVGDTE